LNNKTFTNKMIKILLTGITGQLGRELQNSLCKDWDVIPVSRKEMDLLDEFSVRKMIREIKPDLIINPAAYTQVDIAENEIEQAFAINSKAPRILAEETKKLGIPLIHFSTDFVFDGDSTDPYSEDFSPNPLNVYGKSKLEGENAICDVDGDYLIFRTGWLYSTFGENFQNTIKRLAKEKSELKIINDQIGAPTSVNYIAHVVKKVIEQIFLEKKIFFKECKGIYHLSSGGFCSWYDFAKVIVDNLFQNEGVLCQVIPISTKEYPTEATRPKYSVLDNQKIIRVFGIPQKTWQECFQKQFAE
jgi:dTDP-4-dehydrorhamnose reductase